MISFKNVSKTFDGGVKAVDDVSFTVNEGEIVGFIGPNGSGKTTSMKMLTGILNPDSGTIEVGGYNVAVEGLKAKQRIGYISDNPDQFLRLTGREYIDFIADIYGVSLEDRVERTESLSERFGMTDALDRQITSYSHGMRQKIMVIGALIHEPDEWILDEPMTGLDPESAYELKQMMREHADKGHAVLFSTHVLEVAEKLCDRVVIIRYGHVLFEGTLDELQKLHPESSLEEIFIEMMKEK
ncbi:MAG: ABC transporter ATP-binding protein [Lachnospiraceae bacterium]|jgi:ABC-2 type transport system ATP-binding protein|nr:ABC transporter ATP-binding protein [Lachnospiraceae bacterium]